MWSRFRFSLRNLLRKQKVESDLDAEIGSYVDAVTDEKIAAGLSHDEARRRVLAEIGGMELVKQAVRNSRAGTVAESLGQDIRYGLRQLRRNPAFTWTAVITLGLGIGATTAIFSAVYALLLRPLPFYQANKLMGMAYIWPTHSESNTIISPDFVAAQQAQKSFEQFGGYRLSYGETLTGAGEAVKVTMAGVTANLFPMLGVVPQLGRNFVSTEDKPDGPLVILLSDHLWRNKFHADPGIVGKSVTVSGTARTVVGVLPAHFSFPDSSVEPDYYAPADFDQDTAVSATASVWGVWVIARLRSGASVEQAKAELDALYAARAKNYPVGIDAWAKDRQVVIEPLQRMMTGDDRRPLLILLVSVAMVLLISCANVANLQLARAVSRRHETALRGALGASRLRLIRQFLVESLVLSSLAATLGMVIALSVTSLVRRTSMLEGPQASFFGRAAEMLRLPFGKMSAVIEVDGWVLAFTVGLALLTTLLFGLAPAINGTRSDLRNALQSVASRMTAGREQRLLRHGLLVMEVGLAVVLLAAAGLLVRSFVNVMRYDSGFDPSRTLIGVTSLQTGVVTLHGPSTGRPVQRALNFVDGVMIRLQGLPGVQAVGATDVLPLDGRTGGPVLYEGISVPPVGQRPFTILAYITPDYFRAVGTPIFAGRVFSRADDQNSLPVAIVNRVFASRFFAGDALGKRFRTFADSQGHLKTLTIVGVVDNVRHGGLTGQVEPEAFFPMAQRPLIYNIKFVVRTVGNPALLANALRQAVGAVDPQQPIFDIQTMEQRVGDMVAQRRLVTLLIACFAMLAVVLSAVGVYGVFAYSVSQRTREMGIRLALGASRARVMRLVSIQALRLIFAGSALGLGTAFLLSKLLSSMLVGVTRHDPISFSAAWVLMTAVALLASLIPASQAARTDLVSVLHSE